MLRLSKRTIQTQETTETFQHQIWFSNLFPIKRKYFDLRKPFIKPYASFIALQCRNKLIPSTLSPSSWVAAPNTKEGGLFFKFNFDGNPSDFLDQVNSHLSEKNVSSIWNFQQIQAYSVKGSPFLEDMYGHLPDNRLKIEFEGPDIHMETLYSIFRQYGKIHDISILSLSSKELPRFATIRFYKLRDACSARNCLHGKLVDKTRLSVHYEKPENEGWFWKWVQAHPRISVPILIALIAATSYLVFDPLRSWFITNKISNRFSFETYYKKIQSWFIGSMERMPRFIQSGLGYHSLETHDHFSERKSQQSKLVSTLKESVGTLTLIQGPKGSGKKDLVDSSLSTIKNKLVINLDDLVTQQDAVMLSKLSKQTGFFPELNFLVQFGGIIDSIVFSLTATKSGLGATTESQIQKMFDCVSLSLISLQRARLLRQKESSRNSVEGEVKGINELAEQDFPCIVIEGYMTHENSKQDHLYEKVANWASSLAEDGLANIVFVSSKPASAKSLDKALVSKPIEIVNLDDIPFDSAFAYVKSRVGGTITDLEASVKGVGGRRSDLDALILKIKTGLTAKDAFNDMITKSVTEIRKLNEKDSKWTIPQFWKIVELFSKSEQLDFQTVRFNNIFNGNDEPLFAMESLGLVTIIWKDGRPMFLKCGRPLYQSVFQRMMSDTKLKAAMNIITCKFIQKNEQTKLEVYEKEMMDLTRILTGGGSERVVLARSSRNAIEARIDLLTKLFIESQNKFKDAEEVMKKEKELLKK